MSSEIGEVSLVRAQVEWKIPDFFSLSDKSEDSYVGPSFSFADSEWYLKMYPNGQKEDSSEGWVSIYLCREDSGSPKTVHYSLGIKSSDGVEEEKEGGDEEFSADDGGWGYPKMVERSKLICRKSTLLPNNVLTVICDLRSGAHLDADEDENKLGNSLLAVLKSKDGSDVVIKVQGEEFPAHKLILQARSPVFKSMFSHDMVENETNTVTVEDCDPETFPDFLVHVYSGSCEHISKKNVYSLYATADKYVMGELKAACSRFMRKNLTVSCFSDAIALAVKHSDKHLIECATEFFCDNALDIAKTAEWQSFLKENLTVGNELFIKAMSKYFATNHLT